jgi:UDP-N-acetylmuramyl tripeptide synthase
MTEQKKNPAKISILVDYAHEPESMKQLLTTAANWRHNGYFDYVIHIVSSDGAGRDMWKKPILGKISFDWADFSIVTLDNYDENDNPQEILSLMTEQLPETQSGKKYLTSFSRKEAFEMALFHAKELDEEYVKILIVSTGVGSENGLTQPGGVIKWDEAQVWQELFQEIV